MAITKMLLNTQERDVRYCYDLRERSIVFSTNARYQKSSDDMSADSIDDFFKDYGLEPAGIEEGLHEANALTGGYDFGFNDPKHLTAEQHFQADLTGKSFIWLHVEQASAGETTEVKLEIFREYYQGLPTDQQLLYAQKLLDGLVCFVEKTGKKQRSLN